jgi:hypothetical protein
MSEGLIGELSAPLVKTAVKAVKGGDEQINLMLLKYIKWIPPSKLR